jgi:rod shape-determining protein MreC
MTTDHRSDYLNGLRSTLALIVYPIRWVVDLPVRGADLLADEVRSRQDLIEDNQRLHTEHLLLKSQLQKLSTLQIENMRLRDLLDSSTNLGERVFVAELMKVDLDPYRHLVVINKGSSATLFPGQPALDATGVVGQVVGTSILSSTVMLITDPSHALPIQVNRNGLRSIALGTGAVDRLDLPHLPNSADIKVGDLLITSGLGGRFPQGYPVARVTAVERDPGHEFARVSAAPTAALTRTRELLLVVPRDTQAAADEPATEVTVE